MKKELIGNMLKGLEKIIGINGVVKKKKEKDLRRKIRKE